MGRIHPQNTVAADKSRIIQGRLFFPHKSAARWTMAECVQDSCEFSLFDKKQNEQPVRNFDSHSI